MDAATQQGASVEDRLEAYLGEDEAAPEAETEAVQAEPEAVEEEAEGEEVEASEDDAEEDRDADAQEGEGEQLGLEDLAQYLKIEADRLDVDDEGNVYLKTKVDGEEGRATLQDLIKSYQLEGHLNKQNMEVAEQRKALQAKMAEAEQQAQSRLQQLEHLTQAAYQEMMGEYNAINWQQLREDDPSEFAAKQLEFQQRQQRINQMAQQVQGQRQQSEQVSTEAQRAKLAEEGAKLLQAIPEWSDSAVAQREKSELRQWMLSTGMEPQSVDAISDHREVVLLRKAMLYDRLQSSKPAISKKVKAAPKKLVKPGQSKSQQERAQQSVRSMRSVIQKSGGKQGVEDFLIASGKV